MTTREKIKAVLDKDCFEKITKHCPNVKTVLDYKTNMWVSYMCWNCHKNDSLAIEIEESLK